MINCGSPCERALFSCREEWDCESSRKLSADFDDTKGPEEADPEAKGHGRQQLGRGNPFGQGFRG